MVYRKSTLGWHLISFGVGLWLSLLSTVAVAERGNSSDENWVASWGCAPGFAIGQEFANQTLRQLVHASNSE